MARLTIITCFLFFFCPLIYELLCSSVLKPHATFNTQSLLFFFFPLLILSRFFFFWLKKKTINEKQSSRKAPLPKLFVFAHSLQIKIVAIIYCTTQSPVAIHTLIFFSLFFSTSILCSQKAMTEESSLDTRVVLKGPNGEFKVNRDLYIIVQCEDGKYLEVPKSQLKACPFIKEAEGEEIPEFEYPATVLEHLVRWAVHYGVDGKATSELTRPCIYRDFSYVVTDKWDNDFFNQRLCSPLHQKHFLLTMTAAEKFGMHGLLDFMCVGLGCKLRGKDDASIIHDVMGLDKDVEITDADLAEVSKEYPWFDNSIRPTVKK